MIQLRIGPHLGASDDARTRFRTAHLSILALGLTFSLSGPALAQGQTPRSARSNSGRGNGMVDDQRLYQLIRHPKPIVDRQLEIEFLDPGIEAFAFTFG
jgi:hypothetical protein